MRRPAQTGPLASARIGGLIASLGLVIILILGPIPVPVRAQVQIQDYAEPILTLDTGGHHALVMSTQFATLAGRPVLLSAGLDKVVAVWDVDPQQPEPQLLHKIRPPIWRGQRGEIKAMALSPPNPQGEQILAIAGYGVENSGGNILLYRFPGRGSEPADLLGHLYGYPEGDHPERVGHSNSVNCLAFDGSGRFLASGGVARDPRVLIWDLTRFTSYEDFLARNPGSDQPAPITKPLSAITHSSAVSSVAFVEGGKLLTATDMHPDGLKGGGLYLWDLSNPLAPKSEPVNSYEPPASDRSDSDVISLVVTPDRKSVVVGRENGLLEQHDVPNLRQFRYLIREGNGPVDALAIGRRKDGQLLLATSIVNGRIKSYADFPNLSCRIEVRPLDDYNPAKPALFAPPPTTNIVYAMAFDPGAHRLAYLGDDTQNLILKNLDDGQPQAVPRGVGGQGSSIWEIGFRQEGLALGFSRSRATNANPPDSVEGFDLLTRQPSTYDRQTLKFAVETFGGWTVTPSANSFLELILANGAVNRSISLNRDADGRWFSYTFLPPGPGHPRLLLAVGTRFSLQLFDVETGRKTRTLNGHTGPVYGLAPSPDGRWLASASQDQTVVLWPLAGMDTRPSFGAQFERLANGQLRLANVTPGGHADSAGLESGMIVDLIHIAFPNQPSTYQKPEELDQAVRLISDIRLEGPVEPGTTIVVRVQDPKKPGALRTAGTSRREPPALSLFAGLDRQWVLWMPEGYYDSSINGDKRFVGWHLNHQTSIFRPRKTEFTPLKIHEKTFYNPGLINTLLQTADRAVALAGRPNAGPPLTVKTTTTPMGVVSIGDQSVSLFRVGQADANARVVRNHPGQAVAPRLQIDAAGTSPVVEVTLKIGEQMVEARQVPAPGTTVDVTFNPVQSVGPKVLSIESKNQAGVVVPRFFQVDFGDARKQPSLRVLAIATGQFAVPASSAPPLPSAENDARSVADLFRRHATNPRKEVYPDSQPVEVLGSSMTADRVVEELKALQAVSQSREPGDEPPTDDLVVVFLETHMLQFGARTDVRDDLRALTSDTSSETQPPGPTLNAQDLANTLGEIADYGSTVLVLVDGVHRHDPDLGVSRIDEWIRTLNDRGVAVATASFNGQVSSDARLDDLGDPIGAFARSVSLVLQTESRSLYPHSDRTPYTFLDFQRAIEALMEQETSGTQIPGVFLPDTMLPTRPILHPLCLEKSDPVPSDR